MFLTLLGVSLLASTPALPPASCKTANGETACGYACTVSTREVRCANTPYGVCTLLHGEVHCFDPPLVSIHHPPDEGLRPECKEVRGEVACGFNCLVTKGKVACARTPYGVCREHFGKLTCWDPSEAVIHEFGSQLRRPECTSGGTTTLACGYDCKTHHAQVMCAQSPRGRCEKEPLGVDCFDPPSYVQCAHSQPPDPAEVRKPKAQRREEQAAKDEQTAR